MAKFVIEPHFRLQEWVAEERGYFAAEGLDYVFRELVQATDGQIHNRGDPDRPVAGAAHVGRPARLEGLVGAHPVAASAGHGKLYPDAYSVAPAGIFVPADSPVRSPEQLAGVPISVGYQSGSHYSTIQALEPYLRADQLQLSFNDGMLFRRMELLIEGQSPAAALFSGPYYFAEQLGFRKIIDTTFMITTMIHGQPDPEDLKRFFRALQRAQRDIDVRPDLYTHYYRNEFPVRFHPLMDTRRWGPGERLVFEPYTKEVFDRTVQWIAERGIFAEGTMGSCEYEQSIAGLTR